MQNRYPDPWWNIWWMMMDLVAADLDQVTQCRFGGV
jgi:hypothetical protein